MDRKYGNNPFYRHRNYGTQHESTIQPMSLLLQPIQPRPPRQRTIQRPVRIRQRPPNAYTVLDFILVYTIHDILPQEGRASQIARMVQMLFGPAPPERNIDETHIKASFDAAQNRGDNAYFKWAGKRRDDPEVKAFKDHINGRLRDYFRALSHHRLGIGARRDWDRWGRTNAGKQ